jgi:hypothetical protein
LGSWEGERRKKLKVGREKVECGIRKAEVKQRTEENRWQRPEVRDQK